MFTYVKKLSPSATGFFTKGQNLVADGPNFKDAVHYNRENKGTPDRRLRRLPLDPLEQAKLRQILENKSEGVVFRK